MNVLPASIPDWNETAVVCAGQLLLLRIQSYSVHFGNDPAGGDTQSADILRIPVPTLDHAAPVSGNEKQSVRGCRERGHVGGVAVEFPEHCTGGDIPEKQPVVAGGGRNVLSVRME